MKFGIVVFNQVEELDFVGPWEMLTMWSKFADGPANCLIVGQTLDPIVCANGLSINPQISFANCPPLDYLLIPGGQGTRLEVSNPVLLDFIATQARNCKAVLSICTGAFVMHAAGLLSDKKAHPLGFLGAAARAGRRARRRAALRPGWQCLVVGRRVSRHRPYAGVYRQRGRRRDRWKSPIRR